jgi:hypothetical protein
MDKSPEGISEDARHNVPSGVAYTSENADIDDDALPLDGSLTFKDSEPQDQSGLHPDGTRILTGSEATQTAGGAVDVSKVPPPEDMNATANTTTQ